MSRWTKGELGNISDKRQPKYLIKRPNKLLLPKNKLQLASLCVHGTKCLFLRNLYASDVYTVQCLCMMCTWFIYDCCMIGGAAGHKGHQSGRVAGYERRQRSASIPLSKRLSNFHPFQLCKIFTQHIRSFTSFSSSVKFKFRFSSWLALVSAHLLTNFDKLLTERSDKCFYLHLALS